MDARICDRCKRMFPRKKESKVVTLGSGDEFRGVAFEMNIHGELCLECEESFRKWWNDVS